MCTNGTPSELERLRARVATLEQLLETREQGHRADRTDDATQRLKLQTDMLSALISATDPSHKEDFFHALVYHLASVLKVKYVVMGEFVDGQIRKTQTLAVWAHSDFAENFAYELAGTPCAELFHERLVQCESGVQHRFPQARFLADLGVDGYCGFPLYDNTGRPSGVLAVLDDRPLRLTDGIRSCLMVFASRAAAELEHARAEQALRKSEEHFRTLIEYSLDIITILAPDGTVRYHSPSLQRILGWHPSDRVGRSASELLHPEDGPHAREILRDVLRNPGVSHSMTCRFRHHDGSWRTLESFGTMTEDPQGNPCIVVNSRDITERRLAEEALHQSERELRTVLEALPVGVCFTDTSGKVLLSNPASHRIWSDARQVSMKAPGDLAAWWEATTGRTDPHRWAPSDALTKGTASFNEIMDIECRDGSHKTISNTAVPVHDDFGRITGAIVVNEDITERKRAETALRQRERDLHQALEERERISQDLHDGILQSLYAVGLGLEACKPLLQQRKTAAKALDHAIGQLNGVMREIRAFISGLEPELGQTGDLPGTLQNIVTALAQPYATKFHVSVDQAVGHVVTKEQVPHLLSIVKEAVSNSLRHARAKKATVSLRMLKQCVRLTIRDNGVGFNPRKVQGTGHGLTNIAARARKIGGHFTVRSNPRRGTSVILDIPRESTHAHA